MTVLLASPRPDDHVSVCTGTILAKNLILTASHCVLDENGTKATKVMVLSPVDKKAIEGAAWVAHPGYRFEAAGDSVYTAHDVALVKLKAPLAFKGLMRAKLPVADYFVAGQVQSVFVAGYGRTDPEGDNGVGRLYSGESKAQILPSPLGEDSFLQMEGETIAQLCPGDSGGPVFLQRKDGYYAVGVHSLADCFAASRSASVFHNISWIKKTAAKLGVKL
jgi:hypothetical protein